MTNTTNKPSVTVHIASRGTVYGEQGNTSKVGHMWYEFDNGMGNVKSYGFAPDKSHHGQPFAPGDIYDNDSQMYKGRAYSRTIELPPEQFNAMQNFGGDLEKYGFNKYYNGITNSCIDFTWDALSWARLNPDGFERDVWSTHNINDVESIVNPVTTENEVSP